MNQCTGTRNTTATSTDEAGRKLADFRSIDPEKFKVSDEASFARFWDKTFVQNSVSEGIYEAIAATNNNSNGCATAAKASIRYHLI